MKNLKIITFLTLVFTSLNSFAASETVMGNKSNFDWNSAFYFMVGLGALLVITIFILAGSIRNLLGSDYYKERVAKKLEESKKKNQNGGVKTLLILLAVLIPFAGMSQSTESASYFPEVVPKAWFWFMLAINLVLLMVVLYLKKLFHQLMQDVRGKKEEVVEVKTQPVFTAKKVNKFLTDAVDIEDEHEILLDHEYDGIQELDNNLPPWWIWGFYVSILFGVVYLLNYHVFEISDLQEEAYRKDIVRAQKEIEAYKKKMALNVDEKTVVFLDDASAINRGKEIFTMNCVACHGKEGQGVVGPNLTDDYWLYGGDIKNVFKTVKYGAKNGMKSWKDDLTAVQMQEVSSYIMSIKGSNPANAKEPEGKLYVATTDTAVVEHLDSLNVTIDIDTLDGE